MFLKDEKTTAMGMLVFIATMFLVAAQYVKTGTFDADQAFKMAMGLFTTMGLIHAADSK